MKKKIIFIGIFFLFLQIPKIANADVLPIKKSPSINLIDKNGESISGPTIDDLEKIFIYYNGSDMKKDTTINGYSGVTNGKAQSIIRVKNVGFYNAQPVVLALQPSQDFYISITDSLQISTINMVKELTTKYWIEDTKKNKIVDSNTDMLVNFNVESASYFGPENVYNILEFDSNLKNILIDESLQFGSTLYDDGTKEAKKIVRPKNDNPNSVPTMILQKLDTNKIVYYSLRSNNPYPSGSALGGSCTVRFLESIPIAYKQKNSKVSITKKRNDSTFQSSLELEQFIVSQGVDTYYSDLEISVDLPESIKTTNGLKQITVTNNEGKSVTNKLTYRSDKDGKLNILIPKAVLLSEKNKSLIIKGNFDIDGSNENLLSYFDSSDQYFHFPIEANNSDYSTREKEETLVRMPAPVGKGIEQIVDQYSKSVDLDPSKCVENLSSVLNNDNIEVIGFTGETTFDTLGKTSIQVLIKSKKTDVQGYVTVPINVVPRTGTINIRFLNEKGEPFPGMNLTYTGYEGTTLNLVDKDSEIKGHLDKLITSGYQLVSRPEETTFTFAVEPQNVDYHLTGIVRLTSVPNIINFGKIAYTGMSQRIENPKLDNKLIIEDTRADAKNGWQMSATLSTPMRNSKGQELVNALRYVNQGKETILDQNAQVVYNNVKEIPGSYDISSNWGDTANSNGIKLQINSSDKIYIGDYVGVITWKVMEGQP